MIRLLLVFAILFAVNAQADESRLSEWLVNQTHKKNVAYPPQVFHVAGERTSKEQACFDTYSDLYSKPVVNISVTVGYWDAESSTKDQIRRDKWVADLMTPCEEGAQGACGFTYGDPDDKSILTKETTRPDGKPHTIRLSLVSSSADSTDAHNRGQLSKEDQSLTGPAREAALARAKETAAQQTSNSKLAHDNFMNGLSNADAVIYVGHARGGGGPSFEPPKLRSDGHVDYAWYRAHPASMNEMIAKLKEASANGRGPKFMGLFACDSGGHFANDVLAASPKTGLAKDDALVEQEVAYTQAVASLDSLLAIRCQDDFTESINTFKFWGGNCARPRESGDKKLEGTLPEGVTQCTAATQADVVNFFKDKPQAPTNEVATPDAYHSPGTAFDPKPIKPQDVGQDAVHFRKPAQGVKGVN